MDMFMRKKGFKKTKQTSLYRQMILRILIFLILPFLIISALLYVRILQNATENYNANIETMKNYASTQREMHVKNIYKIIDRISSNSSLNSFLMTEYDAKSWDYYSLQVTQMVSGGLGYDTIYTPKIYFINERIPRGFRTFYRMSDTKDFEVIQKFLKSDDIDCWIMPSMVTDYPTIANTPFTPFKNSYTYMRKVYFGQKLIYLLTLSIDKNQMDSTITDNHSGFGITQVVEESDCLLINATNRLIKTQQDIDTKQYNIQEVSIQDFPQKIIYILPRNSQNKYLFAAFFAFFIFSAGAIFIVLRFIQKIFRSILRCIYKFENIIKSGQFTKLPIGGNDEISKIEMAFNVLIDKVQNLLIVSSQQSSLAKESQLKALQQQINPHFLYNTMELFACKMEEHGHYEESDAMVSFSNIMRYCIADNGPFATIGEELEQVHNYIKLQKIKNTNFSFDAAISQELYDVEIIRFILQPFIENSFIHGYYGEPFHIILSCIDLGEQVLFEIYDNGKGISVNNLQRINHSLASGEAGDDMGIGLKNINARLRLFYSDEYSIKIDSQEGKWTLITFKIPK